MIIVENLAVPLDRRVWLEARTLRDAGYAVSVISPMSDSFRERYEVIEGIEVYRHPLPLEASGIFEFFLEYLTALFWESLLAFRISLGPGFDVIHACNPPDLIFLVALPYRLLGKGFVFDHHDPWPELFEVKFARKGLLYAAVRWCEKLTFKLANVSIATNNAMRRIAIERGGMHPDDVFVVRSGPDPRHFHATAPDDTLRKGFDHIVGYLGVMGSQDGISNLLAAARHIVFDLRRRNIGFMLIGDGPSRQDLEREVKDLDLEQWVFFTGYRWGDDLLRCLSSCDVFAAPDQPNAYNCIITMNKVMEYMAIGKPIVQYDLKDGRDTAQGASLYAASHNVEDFATKLVELINDPIRCRKMGALGQRRVTQMFSWDRERPKLLTCYERLFRHGRQA